MPRRSTGCSPCARCPKSIAARRATTARRQLGVRPLAFVPDGRPGSFFVQDPPILTSDYNEAVVLRDFMVLGDVPTARFLPGRENGGGRDVDAHRGAHRGRPAGEHLQPIVVRLA